MRWQRIRGAQCAWWERLTSEVQRDLVVCTQVLRFQMSRTVLASTSYLHEGGRVSLWALAQTNEHDANDPKDFFLLSF